MLWTATRVAQATIFGTIVGGVIAGFWGAVTGSLLGAAAAGLQEVERRL